MNSIHSGAGCPRTWSNVGIAASTRGDVATLLMRLLQKRPRLQADVCKSVSSSVVLGRVARGKGRALAEKVLFHLLGDDLLRFLLKRQQPVLVEDHLHPLLPHLPRFGGHVVVDALAERARPRRRVEPREITLELDAVDDAGRGVFGGGHDAGNLTVLVSGSLGYWAIGLL